MRSSKHLFSAEASNQKRVSGRTFRFPSEEEEEEEEEPEEKKKTFHKTAESSSQFSPSSGEQSETGDLDTELKRTIEFLERMEPQVQELAHQIFSLKPTREQLTESRTLFRSQEKPVFIGSTHPGSSSEEKPILPFQLKESKHPPVSEANQPSVPLFTETGPVPPESPVSYQTLPRSVLTPLISLVPFGPETCSVSQDFNVGKLSISPSEKEGSITNLYAWSDLVLLHPWKSQEDKIDLVFLTSSSIESAQGKSSAELERGEVTLNKIKSIVSFWLHSVGEILPSLKFQQVARTNEAFFKLPVFEEKKEEKAKEPSSTKKVALLCVLVNKPEEAFDLWHQSTPWTSQYDSAYLFVIFLRNEFIFSLPIDLFQKATRKNLRGYFFYYMEAAAGSLKNKADFLVPLYREEKGGTVFFRQTPSQKPGQLKLTNLTWQLQARFSSLSQLNLYSLNTFCALLRNLVSPNDNKFTMSVFSWGLEQTLKIIPKGQKPLEVYVANEGIQENNQLFTLYKGRPCVNLTHQGQERPLQVYINKEEDPERLMEWVYSLQIPFDAIVLQSGKQAPVPPDDCKALYIFYPENPTTWFREFDQLVNTTQAQENQRCSCSCLLLVLPDFEKNLSTTNIFPLQGIFQYVKIPSLPQGKEEHRLFPEFIPNSVLETQYLVQSQKSQPLELLAPIPWKHYTTKEKFNLRSLNALNKLFLLGRQPPKSPLEAK